MGQPGRILCLGESFDFLADKGRAKAGVMGAAVATATQKLLVEGNSPGRKVGQNDNRTSHYWFARYWAEALAGSPRRRRRTGAHFAPIAKALADEEATIYAELMAGQGTPVDLGGYYHGDAGKTAAVMRPSAALNAIIG